MLLWAPMMAEPPMCELKDLQNGTYSLEDVLDMNILLQWRAKTVRDLQDKK